MKDNVNDSQTYYLKYQEWKYFLTLGIKNIAI